MKDVLDAVSARIKAPYFGYVLLSFIAINWRAFFVLSLSRGTPQARLSAFDIETSFVSLVAAPLLIGAGITLASPWIRYGVAYLSRKPQHLFDLIQLDSEHEKMLRKTVLERSRSEHFADRENELIDRAKRDSEIEDIENEELKARLSEQIEALRNERDKLHESLSGRPHTAVFSPEEVEILKAASQDESGSITRNVWLNGQSIEAGASSFGEKDKREYSKYDAALKALIVKDLVEKVGRDGGLHELTHSGWVVADSLGS